MVAYVIFVNEGIRDPAEMQTYAAAVPSTIQGHPLTILALNGALETLEGDAPDSLVLVSFPTLAEAETWYRSPAYQEVAKHRLAGGKFRVFLKEGVA
jgi:uncharacterized protein (DUF1330 family)